MLLLCSPTVPLLFLYCVPLFENTGAGSLDQILVAQVGSGAGRGGAHDDQDKKHERKRPVAM